ncbi:MAG TPA: DegQ family serine endoprotease [Stellaceae bacterium]|jgi:serine protease Do|nr:DegQ family serine endoprotease [Stellaceae bacterium]
MIKLPLGSATPPRFNLPPWFTKTRAAAVVSVGLGATLALSPLGWAQSTPPSPSGPASSPVTSQMPALPQQSFAPLVKRVLPAVVNISVTEKNSVESMSDQMPDSLRNAPFQDFLRRFFDQHGNNGQMMPDNPGDDDNSDNNGGNDSGTKRIALGSGFIIDPAGFIVTNNHVVGEAAKVEVILQDNSKYTARIVGRDPRTDLAVLKIKADKPLPYVPFGNSSAAQVGDWVVAVGNPFGLGGSVTTGIISARGRDIHTGQFDDFLQIDAPINRGNSGGPTFDLSGEVIGINTAIYSPNGGSVGIGFAVPSNVAKSVVAQLEEHGKVSRGWLGVQIQEITPAIAASLNLQGEHGALVAAVTPGSPGAKAGLKQGDVIMSFNGSEVDKLRDLPRLVSAAQPDSAASIGVWRNGASTDLKVTLGEAPENMRVASASSEPKAERADALGMRFTALTSDLRRELRVPRDVQHGVVISGVESGSPAATLGLARGDVLMSIDQQPVENPDEAAQKLKDIAKSPRKSALLLLNRHGVTQYVGINLSKDSKDEG